MSFEIEISQLDYSVRSRSHILGAVNARIERGKFVALLGENGAGKTTLLDLVMGFRKPTSGKILVAGQEPYNDNWEQRQNIAYLSEKVDLPGDWSVTDFLKFNKFFYSNYSDDLEKELLREFRVEGNNRLGNMSAGEVRRVQVVGALAIQPQLIVVDEITAVLDIIGRRKFLKRLKELNKSIGCTVLLATNILEDLENHVSEIMLICQGKLKLFQPLSKFLEGKEKWQFAQIVADHLEEE